jgi:hypothetical protein
MNTRRSFAMTSPTMVISISSSIRENQSVWSLSKYSTPSRYRKHWRYSMPGRGSPANSAGLKGWRQ